MWKQNNHGQVQESGGKRLDRWGLQNLTRGQDFGQNERGEGRFKIGQVESENPYFCYVQE